MALKVYLGLDPGSDTLKIAYAYDCGGITTGKIVGDLSSVTAIPFVAYYDAEEKRWLFGEEVERAGGNSFITAVKIKSLLSLLLRSKNADVTERNRDYYFNGNHFPKFYFPVKRKLSADFGEAVRADMTFKVEGTTCADLCGQFFRYVCSVVKKRLFVIGKRTGNTNISVIPSVVYPQHVCKEYVEELQRLVEVAFGCPPDKTLSMTKSLCAYAIHTGSIKRGESALIFNIGEEQISVVKASLLESGLGVDGADGHNEPRPLGGNDIDGAVARFLEGEISGRETMGRPSSGEEGHIAEEWLDSKKYLFVKDIKSAKIILSSRMYEKKVFEKGVPVSVSADLFIQRNLTREQLLKCVGISTDSGVARCIADYIAEEVTRPINKNVSKVFLTGGPVETYGLLDYLREKTEKFGVKVLTFEMDVEYYGDVKNDGFNILSHEDALYAPALGCALASLENTDIKTALALTYGLRLFLFEGETPYFEVLVNKGDILPPEGAKFFTPKATDKVGLTTAPASEHSAPMHIMSIELTRADIQLKKRYPQLSYASTSIGKNYLKCDTRNRRAMLDLQRYAGLHVLNGDIENMNSGGRIYYYYNRTRVMLIEKVFAVIGVNIDGEGHAKAFAENDYKRNGVDRVTVVYLWDVKKDGVLLKRRGDRERVFKRDIEFFFDLEDSVFS